MCNQIESIGTAATFKLSSSQWSCNAVLLYTQSQQCGHVMLYCDIQTQQCGRNAVLLYAQAQQCGRVMLCCDIQVHQCGHVMLYCDIQTQCGRVMLYCYILKLSGSCNAVL